VTGTLTPAGIRTGTGQDVAAGLDIAGHLEEAGTEGPSGAAGQPGVAVFPPSAVSVFLTDAHGSPRNSFRVEVSDMEPHGDQIRVRGGGLAADITPAAAAELGLVSGVVVHLVVKSAAVSVYEA
jgi:molybdate transport system ATP-binding protein